MTSQASFKDRIRARMQKTGERYSIARMHVEAQSFEDESDGATEELIAKGRKLDSETAASLERSLETRPHDLAARIKLLAYYFAPNTSAESRERRLRHVLWILENQPHAYVLRLPQGQLLGEVDTTPRREVRQLLLDRLASRGEDASSVAHRMQLREKELLATDYAKAHSIDAGNLHLVLTLGPDFVSMDKPNEALDAVEQALAAQEIEAERFYLLGTAARAALLAGELSKSQHYAEELLALASGLQTNWNYGNAIHQAHLILGEIALQAGDLKKAGAALVEAGKTPGSLQLTSFGPGMRLAKGLAQRGELGALLDYLELCARFWTRGRDLLGVWASIAKSGDVPEFGPYLKY